MYKNLVKEMETHGVTQKDIAELLGRRPATISDKTRDKYPYHVKEAILIRDHFFPDLSIDYLFERSE